MNIHDCKTSLIRKLTRTKNWRLSIDRKYPDARNWPAVCLLEKIAGEARELNEAQWRELQPFFVSDSNGSAWDIALTTACRLVGYQDITDLASFVKRIGKVLRDPQTFAAAA